MAQVCFGLVWGDLQVPEAFVCCSGIMGRIPSFGTIKGISFLLFCLFSFLY